MSTEGQDTIFGSSYREGRKKKFGSLVNLSCLFVLCFQSDKSPFFFPVSSLTLQYSCPITLFLFNNSTSFYMSENPAESQFLWFQGPISHVALFLCSIYFFRNCSSLFSGEFEGKYKPLSEFSKTSNPVDALSQPTSPLTTCSGRARDWPESRGIFRNKDNTFVVFVNEDDHVQFRCFDKGGNLQAVFNKLVRGMAAFERELKKSGEEFMWDDHLGYIVSDPIHLGTALDVRVRVKLHHLSTVSR